MRLVLLVVLGAALSPGGPSDVPTLPPNAIDVIRPIFDRLRPALRYERVTIDHDHVLASVCPSNAAAGACFPVRLTAPSDDCAGQIAGSFCLVFPSGTPPADAVNPIVASVEQVAHSPWMSSLATARPPASLAVRVRIALEGLKLAVSDWVYSWPDQIQAAISFVRNKVLTPTRLVIVILWIAGLLVYRSDQRQVHRYLAAEIVATCAVILASFFWLRCSSPPSWGTLQAFPREDFCLRYGQCFTVGTSSSVVFSNGAAWHEFALILRYFGGDGLTLYNGTIGLMALGAGLLFLFSSRVIGPQVAAPSVGFALAYLGHTSYAEPILDCSFTFLPSVAAVACLVIFARTGGHVALALAGILVAHAVWFHVSALTLVPGLLAVAALAGRQPWRSTGVAVAGFIGSSLVTSAQALASNWRAATMKPLLFQAGFCMLIVLALCVRANGRFRRLSPSARSLIVGAIFVGTYAAGALMLTIIGHPILERYAPPVLAPAAALLATLLSRMAGRLSPARARHVAVFAIPMMSCIGCLYLDAHRVEHLTFGVRDDRWAIEACVTEGAA